jgi:hypothetical protein
MLNYEKFGIRIINNFDLNELAKNPPKSSFLLFNINNNGKRKFIEKLEREEEFLEKLPYRTFLVGEEGELPNNLLKKRICLINQDDVNEILKILKDANTDPRQIILYLYIKWLKHLNNTEGNSFKIFIKRGKDNDQASDSAISQAVISKYSAIKTLYIDKSNKTDNFGIDSEAEIKIHTIFTDTKDNDEWSDLETKWNEGNDIYKIAYTRHKWTNYIDKNPFYYERFSADSVSFPYYFWWPDDVIEKKLRACLLLENSFFNLFIADERICKEKIQFEKNYFKTCHLYPIGKFIADNDVTISDNSKYELRINSNTVYFEFEDDKINYNANNILLIHQGILDKAFKEKDKISLRNRLKYLKNYFPIIVVTSGRGKPANTPDNAKFILLSDVINCFRKNEYPDKLGLINILMNL